MFRRKGPSEVEVARENEVKLEISSTLSKALKALQKENVGNENQKVYSTDSANSVCNCLEAIFLHGLKANQLKKIANYMGLGQQALEQPSLNFWNFVAKFSHSEVVSQLKHLAQITTEIGLCRAWLRVALNDGLMESYVDAMVADKKTLQYYYHRTAYLRDSEQPGIMKTYLQGLMTFEFKLSYNASVLNEWSYAPLLLAGIIDSQEAPPPVIKPAAHPETIKAGDQIRATNIDVRSGKSRSRGNSNEMDRKQKKKSAANPMEARKIGEPPDNTYYVTSSDFTSKDVETIKNMTKKASPAARSECSTSSRISCPDPPTQNLSPSAYLDKKFVASGSESSFPAESEKPESTTGMSDGPDVAADGKRKKFESEKRELVSNDDVNRDETDGNDEIEEKNELEESWEEFFKSPVKVEALQADRQMKRMDSLYQEIKEKVIIDQFVGNEGGGGGEADPEPDSGALPSEVFDEMSNETDDENKDKTNENCANEAYAPKKEMEKEVEVCAEQTDMVETDYDRVYESQNDVNIGGDVGGAEAVNKVKTEEEGALPKIEKNSDVPKSYEEITDQYLEKIVKETNKASSDILTKENLKRLEEELSKQPVFIAEKLANMGTNEEDDDDEIAHRPQSKTRKKRDRSRRASANLKPELSLSPPDHTPLVPELSDAVANNVERMRTLENPDYLSKHRLSLPVTSGVGPIQEVEKRKSLPNILEQEVMGDLEVEIREQGLAADQGEEDDTMGEEEELQRRRQISSEPRQSLGNNLMLTGRGWSSSFDSEFDDTVDAAFSPPRRSHNLPITRPKSESFGTLLQNYTPASSLSAKSIDDVLNNLPKQETVTPTPKSAPTEDADYLVEGFEVVTNFESPEPGDPDRLSQLPEIANEKGLDAQNFQCKGCARALGLIFGKPRVCKFDGGYYCYECHENDEYYIPAIIINNWDFRKHKVSKKNLEFLKAVEEQAHFDIEKVNPRLYDHVPEMQEIQMLRTQLVYLKTYLFTCKQSTAEDLRRLVWPRDYLYESIHLYSLMDLLHVPTGALASSIRKVIKFATKHVYSCRLCNQKGFICELCNNPKVIYAFEMDATYRCPQCRSVYHKECKTDNRPCPKCQRRLLRQNTYGIPASVATPEYDYHVV